MICKFCENKLRSNNKTGLCSKHYFSEREKLPHRKLAHRGRETRLLKSSPNYRLSKYLRNTIYMAVIGNREHKKAIEFLGCSVVEYRKYLENKFAQGMAWDNYGEWHIDHIDPLFKFNLKDKQEFLSASHYTNTQPLWAKDNFIKRDIELRERILNGKDFRSA